MLTTKTACVLGVMFLLAGAVLNCGTDGPAAVYPEGLPPSVVNSDDDSRPVRGTDTTVLLNGHDCCTVSVDGADPPRKGCSNASIRGCVCAGLPDCCHEVWGMECALEAFAYCGGCTTLDPVALSFLSRDSDGDGVSDVAEINAGTDPDDPSDSMDTDGDGIPNRDDVDIDGDGLRNADDPDIDGDGLLNAADPDVDGDGLDNGDDPDLDGAECASDSDCDDRDECVENKCAAGTCLYIARSNGSSCGDQRTTVCHEPDSCRSGVCVSGDMDSTTVCRQARNPCDIAEYCDGNGSCPEDRFAARNEPCGANRTTCTPGACDGRGNCNEDTRAVEGTSCDDGDQCTDIDVCDGLGACRGTPILGCCKTPADCTDDPPPCKQWECNDYQCELKFDGSLPGDSVRCCEGENQCGAPLPCQLWVCDDNQCKPKPDPAQATEDCGDDRLGSCSRKQCSSDGKCEDRSDGFSCCDADNPCTPGQICNEDNICVDEPEAPS